MQDTDLPKAILTVRRTGLAAMTSLVSAWERMNVRALIANAGVANGRIQLAVVSTTGASAGAQPELDLRIDNGSWSMPES